MSKRTYPVPNKNLSGNDYVEIKRAKQLFSGTSNLAKTIEQQNGMFPLLTRLGKQKPYEGTFGLSGRSVKNNKNYCINTSHSYSDLLAITKGKYLLTPPNISAENNIQFKDVADAKKLYNGVYYAYSYNSNNLVAYMNPGYPTSPASYIQNKIEYAPSTDASQRIIVDPSYVITYSSQSCVLNPSVGGNITINNSTSSKYEFNRTINLDLLAGFQYPVKFELDYSVGDCINSNNDIQTKYKLPVPPTPPFTRFLFIVGAQGTTQAILGGSYNGEEWVPSTNGNTIFKSVVNCIKQDSLINFTTIWMAVGGYSTDPGGNVAAYSVDGITWTKSFTPTPLKNANNLLISGRGVDWVTSNATPSPSFPSRWVAVGEPKTITDASGVTRQPSIIYSIDANNWELAYSTDPSLNNPFGVNGVGIAIATNDQLGLSYLPNPPRLVMAVGTGSKPVGVGSTPINIVKSTDGANWSIVTSSPFTNTYHPLTILYSPQSLPPYSPPVPPPATKWIVGGISDGSSISPMYYSENDGVNWSPIPATNQYVGTCYDIGFRGDVSIPSIPNYVAVGINIFGLSNIIYSYDGLVWYPAVNGNSFQPRSIGIFNFFDLEIVWVAAGVGTAGGYNALGYSIDGIQWFNSINGDGLFQNGALCAVGLFNTL